ncbi:ATP-binding protein [Streptosporangium sp. CA-135522]|uniref:ATP-binding protein n=1 Tax=Streptosporangium sp. CA-135522 TaxID=3240072 RepID=UPI003D8BBE01
MFRCSRWALTRLLPRAVPPESSGHGAGEAPATRRLRRHSANFLTVKTLASRRAEDSTIPEPTQNSLVTLEWIGRAENLVIVGPSGTGKSHFTEGLAQAAIEKDLRVACAYLGWTPSRSRTCSAVIRESVIGRPSSRTGRRGCGRPPAIH